MIKSVLLVGLGGCFGSILRYLMAVLSVKWLPFKFPISTFFVNIVGCLIIGIIFGLFEKGQLTNPDYKFLLITGFCGGFTTFSTFSAENLLLIQSGNYFTAISYILLSVILGIVGVWGGFWITKNF